VLSGIPTLGLVLTTAAGAFGIERNAFLGWVMLSKVIRNSLIVFVSYLGLQHVSRTPLA
jgi:membrane protein YqaA with SNARE-associated domain